MQGPWFRTWSGGVVVVGMSLLAMESLPPSSVTSMLSIATLGIVFSSMAYVILLRLKSLSPVQAVLIGASTLPLGVAVAFAFWSLQPIPA